MRFALIQPVALRNSRYKKLRAIEEVCSQCLSEGDGSVEIQAILALLSDCPAQLAYGFESFSERNCNGDCPPSYCPPLRPPTPFAPHLAPAVSSSAPFPRLQHLALILSADVYRAPPRAEEDTDTSKPSEAVREAEFERIHRRLHASSDTGWEKFFVNEFPD